MDTLHTKYFAHWALYILNNCTLSRYLEPTKLDNASQGMLKAEIYKGEQKQM